MMNADYREALARRTINIVGSIALVDADGREITDERDGPFRYARGIPQWSMEHAADTITINTVLLFHVPRGVTIAGWRAFARLPDQENYGGEDFEPVSIDEEDWQFELQAGICFSSESATTTASGRLTKTSAKGGTR